MLSKPDFVQQLTDAYEHLYDFAYLQTQPVLDVLVPLPEQGRKERAWQLHRLLLSVIEELDPGPRAPAFSHEWRRHRLMALRYLDGQPPQAVANELSISRRHFYREHEAALRAVADILWDRCASAPPAHGPPAPTSAAQAQPSADRLELLRLEAARLAQTKRYAPMDKVITGACSVLQDMARQRELTFGLELPEAIAGVQVDQSLLRQMLLGVLGLLIERARRGTLVLAARVEAGAVQLRVQVEPPAALQPMPEEALGERLSALEEMSRLGNVRLQPVQAGSSVVGFEARWPAAPARTVLVVDDNQDVVELYRRYLDAHGYRVVTAHSAEAALELTRQAHPYAVTLDLMMPDQDGWDVLQTILNQPETRHIPMIVCSVLKQKELALSLGAAAFLEKPVSEQSLISTLEALE
jgi:CheY-like chemotaxis protein